MIISKNDPSEVNASAIKVSEENKENDNQTDRVTVGGEASTELEVNEDVNN